MDGLMMEERPRGVIEMRGQWRIPVYRIREGQPEGGRTKIRIRYDLKVIHRIREVRVDMAMSDRFHKVMVFRIFEECDFVQGRTKYEIIFKFITKEVADYINKMCEMGHYEL